MTELINSLKTFAYSGTINCDRRHSSGQLRIIPLLNLGSGGGRPPAKDTGFSQWRDAMRMVARLPGGLPTEFRLKLWENLSEKYLYEKGISWSRVLTKSATPTSRDNEIADQIHKDLHRTGCTGFSGAKQAKLKSVLVAYGRWNPSVGYCQGFNMIGAMLLEMTTGDETLTLKVLIFLIEGVLPQGYFSGGLRGLAVDMAVFREILRMRKPTLHAQLVRLQGGEEQPPLIDVFTMHWFLTLFIHCLPTPSVLRIWDLVLLEGSEVLLRTALVLWAAIETRILEVRSADQFYSVMGMVTKEMLEKGLMDPNSLIKCVVSVGPFPFPGLVTLRQKHRALIQQDTPYKSFFLAKRELDNLKKHYAAIRHRQKATTIILKGLEGSRIKVPGQRSNSLFIPTTKKTTISPKPKLRRGSSGTETVVPPPSGNKGALTPNNNCNTTNNRNQQNATNNNRQVVITAGTNKNVLNNANNHHHMKGKPKQVTQNWDKTSSSSTTAGAKAGKTFRRRRTLSSSSITTSSSSSTELCDSSSSEDDSDALGGSVSSSSSSSEGVWSDSDNKWVKKKKTHKSKTKKSQQLSLEKIRPHPILGHQDSSKENETPPEDKEDGELKKAAETENTLSIFALQDHPIMNHKDNNDDLGSPPSAESDPGGIGGGDREGLGLSRSSSIIDTNDSQHFLEEMSKLGKSDKFYENLSKRICELQFQNLRTLSSCNTVIDPKSLALPPFPRSPLASPISPFAPPDNNVLKLSPRGSTSGGESGRESSNGGLISPTISPGVVPKTPNSPGFPGGEVSAKVVSISRKTSKSSMSSIDIPTNNLDNNIPDICVELQDDGEDIFGERKHKHRHHKSKHRNHSRSHSSSCPGSVSPTDLGLHFPEPSSPFALTTTVEPLPLTFPESASISEGTVLLSPRLTTPSSPQKGINSSGDIEEHVSLVSPKSPVFSPKRKFLQNNPVGRDDEDSFLVQVSTSTGEDSSFLFPSDSASPFLEESTSPNFPVTVCPSQCFTSSTDGGSPSEEEIKINAVIRENIAILQRLKLKSAYLDGYDYDEEEEEDESYEEIEEHEDDEDDGHHSGASSAGGGCRRSGSLGSEDRDSGVAPSSSKNSVVITPKERLSSVSSNSSGRSGRSSSGRRRSSGSGAVSGGSGRRLSRGNSFAASINSSSINGGIAIGKSGCAPGGCGGFNPFPTVRKARLRVTKYGLYN